MALPFLFPISNDNSQPLWISEIEDRCYCIYFLDKLFPFLYIQLILRQVLIIIIFSSDHSARVLGGLNFHPKPKHSSIKTIFPKELRVQSKYDQAGKNNKGGRLNYVEKERGEKREERGERGKFVGGVVRR